LGAVGAVLTKPPPPKLGDAELLDFGVDASFL
jgi:hypothetical protein